MTDRLSDMTEQRARRELLAKMLGDEEIELPKKPIEPGRKRAAAAPLSLAQERLWFLSQLDPRSAVYNIARALRLKGSINHTALGHGIDEIVRRHEILRTRFPCAGDAPVQKIEPKLEGALQLVDLTALPGSRRRTEAMRILTEESRAPFDLERGPLIKTQLIKLGEAEHLLLLVLHQMVCDGWSMSLFLRELAALYRSYTDGKAMNLPELEIQYSDYAARRTESLRSDALRAQLDYWRGRLKNSSSGIGLVTDRPRPALQSFRGARLPFKIAPRLVQSLNKLGRKSGATPFMVLMAAFNVLLWRYSAQQDISVGFPVANRNRRDLRDLIGFFVNTLVLRTHLSGNLAFTELLESVRDHCRDALAHQDLPFDRLVDELQLERDLSRNPLFEVMFAYQSDGACDFAVPGVKSRFIELGGTAAKFDLTLSITDHGDSAHGYIEYATDLFDHDTVRRLARHFVLLLRGIAANPTQSIARLPLLKTGERRQILVGWNKTGVGYPARRCMHQLFEAQARRGPRAAALECAGQHLTYGELNRRANRLARFLRTRGAGPEKLVGVCMDRSLEMVIALLAVLKSGAAYVPLDPRYPRERIRFMLEDARVKLLLTQSQFAGGSAAPLGNDSLSTATAEVVCLDTEREKIAKEKPQNVSCKVRPCNLAYVIYTSGSTGRPKGVAIEHRNAVAFLQWAKRVFSRGELAGVLASTSICFDLSVFELFAPLSSGGKVILLRDALELTDSPYRNDITLINTVPSALRELLAVGGLPRFVRTVNLAGEPLKSELVQELYATGTVNKVYDLYGPSETTTYSTFTLRAAGGRATIGRPIADTRIYLLDAALQPVPIGVPGELFIGGAGVARGYLGRPKLTAAKFLHDPFIKKTGARMYRTGDLARYYADGSIEYLGRADDQVKIRGYRIELGEVEAALSRHPAICRCVVVARELELEVSSNPKSKICPEQGRRIENPKFAKQLLAYFVAKGRNPPSAIELRNFLREKLPEFMLPAHFILLQALPLTPSGKVDRRALAEAVFNNSPERRDFTAPRTEAEEMIAQIWRHVLKLERIGVFDDFFEMGGHSLLAIRVAARMRAHFHTELPLRKIFEARTIAALARAVETQRRAGSGIALPPLARGPDALQAPLSSSQRRLWFLYKLDPALTAYNMPAAYRVQGRFAVEIFERALDRVIERHEMLHSCIAEAAGEPMLRIVPDARLSAPVIDWTGVPAKEAEERIAQLWSAEADQPYDLAAAPLMRVTIFRLGADEHVVSLNFHHIICDGSSLAIFYRELAAVYESLSRGGQPFLPPLAVRYADFSLWQQNALKQGSFKAQIEYWATQLAGVGAADLPADALRAPAQSYRGGKVTQRLSVELSAALKELARKEQVTLFMVLLAALKILLARLAGKDDIVIGSTIAGRNHPELEGVIGFFINALPLRTDLSGNPQFVELLHRVREVCLDAYTHQDLPFERLVEELHPQRELSRNPLFQALFNMAEIAERDLQLPGCVITRLHRAAAGAKFDLVFQAPEFGGAIELTLVYNAGLFSESRAQAMLAQWGHLLSQASVDPTRQMDRFSLVTPAAEALLPNPLEALDDSWHGPIHSWVARSAEAFPDKTAVIDDDQSWSYRELDRSSNQLAHHLLASGIEPQSVVAIYAHRDSSLALALLGILKAGAIFVILDPAYPPARLLQYLRIVRPGAWLQMEAAGEPAPDLQTYFAERQSAVRIKLPRAKRKIARLLVRSAVAAPEVSLTAEAAAYIAFTSGSTGEPKGVLCRHGPISHFLPWQIKAFGLTESDRYALLSGLGYNHLHRDIFTPLALGATLCVPAGHELRDPERLARWLRRREVSVMHLTPALGRFLQTQNTVLPSVRRLFFGGDLLLQQDLAAMRRLAPNARLVSLYGATETQRAVGYCSIDESALQSHHRLRAAMPIGRGAPGVQLLLLTPSHQLAGIGEIAELYVRSPHLAIGYVGDRALSDTHFVTNPFTQVPRDRLYRTRELGRYLPDGHVEWVGRSDRRANIRGFRVELAEIETTLSQCAGVRQAAVAAQNFTIDGMSTSEPRLVAFFECEPERALDGAALREFLNGRLPPHMIPSYFYRVERIPLNSNGKIDYDALAQAQRSSAQNSCAAPGNDLERAVAKIFAEVLQAEQIGRRDNFFELGGHSLLAAKAAARLREVFGIELDLREFFEWPTVEAICLRVAAKRRSERNVLEIEEREEIEL
jgi:amino acid adenylation domain-containing protein